MCTVCVFVRVFVCAERPNMIMLAARQVAHVQMITGIYLREPRMLYGIYANREYYIWYLSEQRMLIPPMQ